jgi:hypothetical protein
LHRDSLGSVQVIRPGQVNLMTAGRGIAHSEESLPSEHQLHAAQLWIALPEAEKDCAPAFDHYPDLPSWIEDGLQITLLAGTFSGRKSPARIYTPLVGVDLLSREAISTRLVLDSNYEYGIVPIEGAFTINGQTFASNEMAYLGRGLDAVDLQSQSGAHALLLGGEPFAEDIYQWWNFVGHSEVEIAQALLDWNSGNLERFGEVVGFDGERLVAPPLPW